MGLIGGALGYRLLRAVAPQGGAATRMDGSAYANVSKLRVLLGDELLGRVRGKDVLDFGCGAGEEAIELARHGAASVVGLDIQEGLLKRARESARAAGLTDRVRFERTSSRPVDIIISIDSFEHFAEPGQVLAQMRDMLRPGGEILASFGPTWYHPLGGHLFSVFPWAHLLFTEGALIRWRSDFKTDGARRFGEVAGGLNQMTIRRFRRLVKQAGFASATIEPVPIRRLGSLHNRLTEEFTSAIVRARLTR